ncbi:MAG: hypothetical protein IK094_00715 [Treponema sp.]|nr:hypothetical protein [Treponema sp.]
MEAAKLTGIERELVLQYLIDGNVPVTVTPIADEEAEVSGDGTEVKPATSALFPIAIKAEQLKVLEQGIILLTNPPQNVKNFIDKKVRVEFYFNRLGLYFETKIKQIKAGLALVIPSSISRIQESPAATKPTEISAQLYFSVNQKTDVHIDCVPAEGYQLFTKPVWKDIAEEAQVKAKEYLEEFIVNARQKGVAGSGVQLIPVVRYLAEKVLKMESVQNRRSPLEILFINHERIVFGQKAGNADLQDGMEYALEMSFPLPRPLSERKIFGTCRVESNYYDENRELVCVVCRYTSLQEEDIRFLYEKGTGEKFI